MANTTLNAVAPPVPVPEGTDANCSITNNSGVDIMVLDGSSPTGNEILFEQDLKILQSNGSNIIKAGTTGTVVLDDSYIDPDDGTAQYSMAYNLIIVRASDLFPIKVVGELEDFDNNNYAPITVTAADLTAMQDSQKFQQTLQAFPDSVLATNFANACNEAMNNSNSDTDVDSTMDAFFASTDNYKDVTLNSLTAIQTYWETFPYVWAGYAASKTYYLYTSDDTLPKYMGQLDITAPTSAEASVDKSLSGFTMSFTPNGSSTAKALKYDSGQFVDSIEETSVALKGIYQLKSQLTNVATDNTITAYMMGSVNNDKVLGFNEKLTQDSQGNWSGFYQMLHPKDAAGWLALVLEIGAVAMTLELFSRPLKWLKDKLFEKKAEDKGKEPSQADADAARSAAKAKQAGEVTDAQRVMDRMSTDINIKIALDINGSTATLQTDRSNRTVEDTRSNQIDINVREQGSVRTLSKYAAQDATLEATASKVKANKDILNPTNTDTATLEGKLGTVKSNVTAIEVNLPVITEKVAAKTSAEEKLELSAAQQANEEAKKIQEEIDKNKDTSNDGDDDDVQWDDDEEVE